MGTVGGIFEFSAGNAVDGLPPRGNFVTKEPSEARSHRVASVPKEQLEWRFVSKSPQLRPHKRK